MLNSESLQENDPRLQRPIFRMLKALSDGKNISPKKSPNYIIFDIEVDPKLANVTRFENRVFAFKQFIEDFYLIETRVVGMQDMCIRVFLEPANYNNDLRNDVVNQIDKPLFLKTMVECEVSRAFFYGITLTLNLYK